MPPRTQKEASKIKLNSLRHSQFRTLHQNGRVLPFSRIQVKHSSWIYRSRSQLIEGFFYHSSTVFADHKDPSGPKFCLSRLCEFWLKTVSPDKWQRLWWNHCLPEAATVQPNRRKNALWLWTRSIIFGPTLSHQCLHPSSTQLCKERLTWVTKCCSVTYLSVFHSDTQHEQVPDELHLQKSQDQYIWSYWAEANNFPSATSKPLLFVWIHVTVMKASNWSMGDMTVRQGSFA